MQRNHTHAYPTEHDKSKVVKVPCTSEASECDVRIFFETPSSEPRRHGKASDLFETYCVALLASFKLSTAFSTHLLSWPHFQVIWTTCGQGANIPWSEASFACVLLRGLIIVIISSCLAFTSVESLCKSRSWYHQDNQDWVRVGGSKGLVDLRHQDEA